uniref:Uncharacterized protein n=1 Tax=Cannabis sativa TaxID=3483 RepID=A0A803NJC8_CANSA
MKHGGRARRCLFSNSTSGTYLVESYASSLRLSEIYSPIGLKFPSFLPGLGSDTRLRFGSEVGVEVQGSGLGSKSKSVFEAEAEVGAGSRATSEVYDSHPGLGLRMRAGVTKRTGPRYGSRDEVEGRGSGPGFESGVESGVQIWDRGRGWVRSLSSGPRPRPGLGLGAGTGTGFRSEVRV